MGANVAKKKIESPKIKALQDELTKSWILHDQMRDSKWALEKRIKIYEIDESGLRQTIHLLNKALEALNGVTP